MAGVKKKEVNNGVTQFNGDVIVNGKVEAQDSSNLSTKTKVLQVETSLGRKSTEALKQTVATMAEDMKLTPVEKVLLADEWAAIQARHTTLSVTAGLLDIQTESPYTIYLAAYTALSDYMGILLTDMNSSTAIVRAQYDTTFDNYFLTVAVLTELITQKENVSYEDLQEGFENEYGTKIPEAPTLVVRMEKRTAHLLWTTQPNLSARHTWDVQVSETENAHLDPDNATWYALGFMGQDWKAGSIGGCTGGIVIPGLDHTNIPNAISGNAIAERTLYWRVRTHMSNETLDPYLGPWSNIATGTTVPIAYDDIGPDAIKEEHIAPDSVTGSAINLNNLDEIDKTGRLTSLNSMIDGIGGDNLVKKSIFTSDGDKGAWQCNGEMNVVSIANENIAPLSGYTHCLKISGRDFRMESGMFPVTEGERLYIAGWVNAGKINNPPANQVQFGLRMASDGVLQKSWPSVLLDIPLGTDEWKFIWVTMQIPAGYNGAIPYIVTNAPSSPWEGGDLYVQQLYWGRSLPTSIDRATSDPTFIDSLFANTFAARKITAVELDAGILGTLVANVRQYVTISDTGFTGANFDQSGVHTYTTADRRAYLDQDELTFQKVSAVSNNVPTWSDTIKIGGANKEVILHEGNLTMKAGSIVLDNTTTHIKMHSHCAIGYGIGGTYERSFYAYLNNITSTGRINRTAYGSFIKGCDFLNFYDTNNGLRGYIDFRGAIFHWGGNLYVRREDGSVDLRLIAPYNKGAVLRFNSYNGGEKPRWSIRKAGLESTNIATNANTGGELRIACYNDDGSWYSEAIRVYRNNAQNSPLRTDFYGEVTVKQHLKILPDKAYNMGSTHYGAFWRNDNSQLYLLLTDKGNALGSWNSLRPFYVNLANGLVKMNNGISVSGIATFNNDAVVQGKLTCDEIDTNKRIIHWNPHTGTSYYWIKPDSSHDRVFHYFTRGAALPFLNTYGCSGNRDNQLVVRNLSTTDQLTLYERNSSTFAYGRKFYIEPGETIKLYHESGHYYMASTGWDLFHKPNAVTFTYKLTEPGLYKVELSGESTVRVCFLRVFDIDTTYSSYGVWASSVETAYTPSTGAWSSQHGSYKISRISRWINGDNI